MYKKFLDSVDEHFEKMVTPVEGAPLLDIYVLDFKNFDEFKPELRIAIMNYINDPNYKYKDLVNSSKFIKIN